MVPILCNIIRIQSDTMKNQEEDVKYISRENNAFSDVEIVMTNLSKKQTI